MKKKKKQKKKLWSYFFSCINSHLWIIMWKCVQECECVGAPKCVTCLFVRNKCLCVCLVFCVRLCVSLYCVTQNVSSYIVYVCLYCKCMCVCVCVICLNLFTCNSPFRRLRVRLPSPLTTWVVLLLTVVENENLEIKGRGCSVTIGLLVAHKLKEQRFCKK